MCLTDTSQVNLLFSGKRVEKYSWPTGNKIKPKKMTMTMTTENAATRTRKSIVTQERT